jgi:putative membrane protein
MAQTILRRREIPVKLQAIILSTALVVPMTLAGQSSNYESSNRASNNTSQLSKQDKLFLHTIASEDQSEIELAHLALQKSKDPQIQKYAKTKILEADPSMKQQAMQLAEQNHTTISGSPNATAKARYKDLASLSGKSFERSYAKYEGWKQAADLKAVKQEATSANNPEVRAYAKKETAPVQQAAQSAQKLAQSMNVSTHE